MAYNTVLKLLPQIGAANAEYRNKAFHHRKSRQFQIDEIWSFCYAKAKNVPEEEQGEFGYGDTWIWVAIDADTKLIPLCLLAGSDAVATTVLMQDLAGRWSSG